MKIEFSKARYFRWFKSIIEKNNLSVLKVENVDFVVINRYHNRGNSKRGERLLVNPHAIFSYGYDKYHYHKLLRMEESRRMFLPVENEY